MRESILEKNSVKEAKRILVISDLQIPCQHPDAFKFLKALKDKFKPTMVVQIGDIVDFGSLSNYDADPDYLSPRVELECVKSEVKKLSKIFPKMSIVMGNHEMRLYRKALKAGLPSSVISEFRNIIGAPLGWVFGRELKLFWNKPAKRIRFIHTESGANRKRGMKSCYYTSVVHGHLHTDFAIQYTSTADALYWDMNVGCLIDDESVVFAYNKSQALRPIYGSGIIENGQPRLIPMIVKKGKWDGNVHYSAPK